VREASSPVAKVDIVVAINEVVATAALVVVV
jgi:hypothetical protein